MTNFDPARFIMKIKGKDYLEVKWRLVWLRLEHPNAHIVTTLHQVDSDHAIFSAHVSIPNAGSASGWAKCTPSEFPDYVEKAETSALGRALAALGYGTQFADHDDGIKLSDAPVERRLPEMAQASTHTQGSQPTQGKPAAGELASDTQKRKIWATARDKNWSDEQLHYHYLVYEDVRSMNALTKRQASNVIEYLLEEGNHPEDQQVANDFLQACITIQSAQTMDELKTNFKSAYLYYEDNAVLKAATKRIYDYRKAELTQENV